MARIAVGDKAPEFDLEGTEGRTYRLADCRGHWLVLAFYPGDFTPVCTRQFCSYRDAADRLDELDATVWGISPQSVDSHERFRAKYGLTVPLLADPDASRDPRLRRAGAGRARAPLDLHRRSRRAIVRYRHVALLGLHYRDVEDCARRSLIGVRSQAAT